MSTVRAAPGTLRSPKTAGPPPDSSTRVSSPRRRMSPASHSLPSRTPWGFWLTVLRRRNSRKPSTMARRLSASLVSNAFQSAVMRLPYLDRKLGGGLCPPSEARGASFLSRPPAGSYHGNEESAPMSLAFLIFLAAVAAIVIFVIVSYNRLVSLSQRTQSAWSDVDVQLKRRTDLVPNLVESVKGYAAHERGTLDAVVKARSAAVAAQTPDSRAQAEGQLSQALRGLFALAESYPDLKATANFQALQASLGEIEDTVQSARRYFNAVVRDLNTTIEIFPSNLVAGLFQFREHAYFELDRPGERQVPKVSFGA